MLFRVSKKRGVLPNNIKNGDQKFFEQYKLLLMGLISSFGEQTTETEKDVERIIEIEKDLGNITQGQGFIEGWWTHMDFNESITIRELSFLIPSVSWKDYIVKT